MAQKCGYIALVGRPNAGKSTLLNALIGQKIAGVSTKPQTTRNKILGILTESDTQFLFLDSPGMHKDEKRRFNALMNREARQAARDADVVCYLADMVEGWQNEDTDYLVSISSATKKPIIILGTKADKRKQEVIAHHAAIANEQLHFLYQDGKLGEHIEQRVKLISAKRPENLQDLKLILASYLPEGVFLYEIDDMTDRSQKFVCSEFVREALFRLMGQEIPYQLAVVVDQMEEKDGVVLISASIIASRASQKAMVIGKGGAKIKEIGKTARESLERHFDKKVFLSLEVFVAENWTDSRELIAQYAELDPE